jgi:hypothetical protein
MSHVSQPDSSGCEMWTAAVKSPGGYGKFGTGTHLHSRSHLAHRWRYIHEVLGGVDPGPSVEIRHSCHVRHCVALAHLSTGSHADNERDKREADRHARGTRHGSAKLTDSDVIEILRRYAAGGVLQRELAAEYGVSRATIAHIIGRKTWRHLDEVAA